MQRRTLLLGLMGLGLAGCGLMGAPKAYRGPKVTQITVSKSRRKMWLMHNKRILRRYNIGLGFAPEGHKKAEGDGRTPEGTYFIDRRNPNSAYHLSLGISYPNANDVAVAKAAGVEPGGDIFIHGRGPRFQRARGDWTWGCIAVTDREMTEIYSMVQTGTPIVILP